MLLERKRKSSCVMLVRMLLVFAILFSARVSKLSVSAAHPSSSPDHAQLETHLYGKLFTNYVRLFRPANHTIVSIALSLASVVEVNEQEGHITTTFIPKMMWNDPRLVWNRTGKSEFHNVDHLQVPDKILWLPDLEVLNRFKDVIHDTAMEPLAWVHSSGMVYYVPRRTYHTPCTFDLYQFPYDQQVCKIVLGSWAYLQNEVDFVLMNNGTDVDFYNIHNEFLLKNLTIERKESTYGMSLVPFVELVMSLTLQRRPSFFYYMYLMPANVILLSFSLIHALPPNSSCKFITLGTVFICSILMLHNLNGFLPSYATAAPKILRLYLACFLCSMASTFVSCVTLSMCNTNEKTRQVPRIFRKLMGCKEKVCCERSSPTARFDYQLLHLERAVQNESQNEQELAATNNRGSADSQQPSNSNSDSPSAVIQILQQLVSELQLARYREQVKTEWFKLAQLVDFVFSITFVIVAFAVISKIHS